MMSLFTDLIKNHFNINYKVDDITLENTFTFTSKSTNKEYVFKFPKEDMYIYLDSNIITNSMKDMLSKLTSLSREEKINKIL